MSSVPVPVGLSRLRVLVSEQGAELRQRLSATSALRGVRPASSLEVRPAPETVSSGIRELDALTSGLPRGGLTEICGAASSGRTSLLLAALAAATRRQEACALVDASDTFDPRSAVAAGVDLSKLLWVRCSLRTQKPFSPRRHRDPESKKEEADDERRRMENPLEQGLRVTDLLLQSGGFGMIAMDLGDVPSEIARRIPLASWFRFRRAVENTPTVLLVLEQQPIAGSCSSLLLRLAGQVPGIGASLPEAPTHAQLLCGLPIAAELLRTHRERKPAGSTRAVLTTRTAWAG